MDFSTGHFPIDIIIFALLAGFLILRLRSVLGKKTGFEQKERSAPSPQPKGAVSALASNISQPVAPMQSQVEFVIPAQNTQVGQALIKTAQLDPTFVTQKFLEGAEIVFRKILIAFANEDLQTLKAMLMTDAYSAFEGAILARRNLQETQKIEIKTIHSVEITKAQVTEGNPVNSATIEVKFVSDQVNCTFNKDKNPVMGTESITEFIDFWIFERMLGVNNQGVSWRLKSARSG